MALLKRLTMPAMCHDAAQSKITDVEIYFGTMFGSAERYARTLAQNVSTQRRVRVTVHDLDGFDERWLARRDRLTSSRLFVFVVSTHFAGAPSPSAERFRNWINELVLQPHSGFTSASSSISSPGSWLDALLQSLTPGRRPQPFQGMQYAVFGVGDSAFLTFNAMGKFVDLKLRQLGATRVCAIGLGDCSNDLDGTFKSWEATLLRKLPMRLMSQSHVPLGFNFVSVFSSATAGRRVSTAAMPGSLSVVVPLSTTANAATQRQIQPQRAKSKSRVVPQDPSSCPSPDANVDPHTGDDADAVTGTSTTTPMLTVRDNFGRMVRLRFACVMLSDNDDYTSTGDAPPQSSNPPPLLTHTPSYSPLVTGGLRTPRVALFDSRPFAEIEAIEVVGDAPPPSGVSPSLSSSSPSSRRNAPSPAQRHQQRQRPPHHTKAASWSRAATFRMRLLNAETSYVTVSTVAIFPQNAAQDVEQIAQAFGYDLDALIELRAKDPTSESHGDHTTHSDDSAGFHVGQHELPFPTPCTIRTALTEFIDIRTVTCELLHVAAGFVVTTDEHDALELLASAEGTSAFKAQIQDPHKGLVDLLELAPTLQIPLEVFVSIMPIIRPRYYTVGSSPRVAPRELDLAVSLGRAGQPQGCAVAFFEQVLAANRRVSLRGFISHSRFQFPDDGVSPMVLIAAGVGVSAMRAIIQDRLMRWFQAQADPGGAGAGGAGGGRALAHPPSLPKHILFLGAANEDTIVFRDDLRYWEQQLYVKVHYAFSNDTRVPRQYIQEVIVTRMDEIFQAVHLSANSRIFVCGRVPMVRRVREIFETDQVRRGNTWFDTIHSSGRFIDEGFN